MIAEFDPDKDQANRVKHGVPLLFGVRLFEDENLAIIPTLRIGDEEERFKAGGSMANYGRPSMSGVAQLSG